MKKGLFFLFPILFLCCKSKVEKIKPVIESISESIYASGIIKSKDQYQVFSTVNGVVENVFVKEGDTVKKGSPIVSISKEVQLLNKENAELTAVFNDLNTNQGKLNEASQFIELARNKLKNDSALYYRQKYLWQEQIGTRVELEKRELEYQNSKTEYSSAIEKYDELKRQLNFASSQSKKNLLISKKVESDYLVKSEISGIVYNINKSIGEMVGTQTPLAIIGDAKNFILEMQVDETDIVKIRKGLPIQVTLDSYKGKVFEASVTRVIPLMNERSKTFLVEAAFIAKPDILYPNISFEANIVLQSREKAMLIPRSYMLNDSVVVKSNGEKVVVKTGLKDYLKIEILSGLHVEDELIKPL